MSGQLYAVDAEETRTVRFYVRADSWDEADEAAKELAREMLREPDDVDNHANVRAWNREPEPDAPVWRGGPKGGWDA